MKSLYCLFIFGNQIVNRLISQMVSDQNNSRKLGFDIFEGSLAQSPREACPLLARIQTRLPELNDERYVTNE